MTAGPTYRIACDVPDCTECFVTPAGPRPGPPVRKLAVKAREVRELAVARGWSSLIEHRSRGASCRFDICPKDDERHCDARSLAQETTDERR